METLTVEGLRRAYLAEETTPDQVVTACLTAIQNDKHSNAWITVLELQQLTVYLERLKNLEIADYPLWGIPFAIKDNIDLANCPTTAACPAYAYTPSASAFVVEQLINAGAIPLGKTNMDQFATGLVGTRSPHGAVPCVFDKRYISGGSSSGSAYAVATGQAAFALGTDTAGSGRVPAAFNELVGVKPSRGLLSCRGVVPACKSLDCVSIFCHNIADAQTLLRVTSVYDDQDSYARPAEFYATGNHGFKLGVPKADQRYFLNDNYQALFEQALNDIADRGIEMIEVDFSPFTQAAKLLYEGPWVAERYHAVGEFLAANADKVDATVAAIIGEANSVDGHKAFEGFYQLQALKQQARTVLANVDAIITPTVPTQFTIDAIAQSPITHNSALGYYTNFINLLDCSALAIPAGKTAAGLAFGVTVFGPAHSDIVLQQIAAKYLNEEYALAAYTPPDKVRVAVCGAHLQGMPLNWQLSCREAVLVQATTTAPYYELYALAGGPPYRPGIKRVTANGEALLVEVWEMPAKHFGSFVTGIPAPLGIGKVELADGSWVPGFICEPYGMDTAEDITELKSWRVYMQQKTR